jgi:acetoacetyl-CoA synthetase
MGEIKEGDLLWQPSDKEIEEANLTCYLAWLRATKGLDFAGYAELWHWSVTELEAFWASLWDYFAVVASAPYTAVLGQRTMPGACWFPGARLNYAENLFRQQNAQQPALWYQSETEALQALSWAELADKTARVAAALRRMGVAPGDRVVAYLPNVPEAVIAFLATASIGAIWSSCPPDFGDRSVLDRFTQIAPKVLFACDGYSWGGKPIARGDVIAKLLAELPTVEQTVIVPSGIGASPPPALPNVLIWDELLATTPATPLTFEQVPFDHPLWVLYTSGTTGLPKPIVQGHGGILLEHRKAIHLHLDLKPADRFFWYTSTGWMMWNFLLGGLLNGTPIVLYNGSPGYPDLAVLWRLAETTGTSYFGTSAAFIQACIKAGLEPGRTFDLSRLRAIGSTGSPLPAAGFQWIYAHVSDRLALESISGGTDLCTAFLGGVRLLPIYAGELQAPALGADVQAWDDDGRPLLDEVGELVITQPMPSMPLFFWNDPAMSRYRESYFEHFPGVWRHGDWLKLNERHGGIYGGGIYGGGIYGGVIYGRSDSTINRQGIRMGTSEIYQAVHALPEIADSLVVDLELLGRASYMPLFVVLQPGVALDDDLRERIRRRLREQVSPRHVPDEIFVVDEIPYTLSGKKMEVPIRKILLGQPPEKAANQGAMRNPGALAYFIQLAQRMK